MPKFRTTNKEMMNEALTYAVGYCDLQNLFHYKNAVAYTAGTYGWNSDIYLLNGNTYISTGYRPCGYRLADGWIYRALDRYAEKVIHDEKDYNKAKLLLDNAIYMLACILQYDWKKDNPIFKEHKEENTAEYNKLIDELIKKTGYSKDTVYNN